MARRVRSRIAGSSQGGQGLVETALILPIFLLIVFGLFDVGRMVYTNSVLSQAAREGARLAAAEGGWIGSSSPACVADPSGISSGRPGAHVCPADVTALKSHIVSAANRMAISVGPIDSVHISCNAGSGADLAPTGDWTETSGGNGCQDGSGNPLSASGEVVSVRVEHTYDPITPVIGTLIGSVTLSGSATMVVH